MNSEEANKLRRNMVVYKCDSNDNETLYTSSMSYIEFRDFIRAQYPEYANHVKNRVDKLSIYNINTSILIIIFGDKTLVDIGEIKDSDYCHKVNVNGKQVF